MRSFFCHWALKVIYVFVVDTMFIYLYNLLFNKLDILGLHLSWIYMYMHKKYMYIHEFKCIYIHRCIYLFIFIVEDPCLAAKDGNGGCQQKCTFDKSMTVTCSCYGDYTVDPANPSKCCKWNKVHHWIVSTRKHRGSSDSALLENLCFICRSSFEESNATVFICKILY